MTEVVSRERLPSTADAVLRLAEESRDTSDRLAEAASVVLLGALPDVEVPFVAFSVDLTAGSYYSLATNLARESLLPAGTLHDGNPLELLRSLFPVYGGDGVIARACVATADEARERGDGFLVALCPTQRAVTAVGRDGGARDKIAERVRGAIGDSQLPSQVGERLKSLMGAAAASDFRVLLRPHAGIDSPRHRTRVQLVDVVLWLSSTDRAVSGDGPKQLFQLCDTVAFATLSLLSERERYYEKGLRQSTRGRLVKHGPVSEIREQVELLARLHRRAAADHPACVPHVIENNEGGAEGHAWYAMPYFTLPPLMQSLTSVPGMKKHEVVGLTRASVVHLAQTYWRELHRRPFQLRERLAATVGLLVHRAREALNATVERAEAIQSLKPIIETRGVTLYRKSDSDLVSAVLQQIRSPFTLETRWGSPLSQVLSDSRELPGVTASLERVVGVLKRFRGNQEQQCLRASGQVHGDPHYGNLLADASVPEDPVVASIDPKVVMPRADLLRSVLRGVNYVPADLDGAIATLQYDPAYDVSKMLLSSSASYSICYRGAVRVEHAADGIIRVRGPTVAELRDLGDAGGVTGAGLIRMTDPVVIESKEYHSWSARAVLDEFRRRRLSVVHSEEGYVADLAHLWALTCRHSFSVAELLFPRRPANAAAMFVSAADLLGRGVPVVEELAVGRFESGAEALEEVLTRGAL